MLRVLFYPIIPERLATDTPELGHLSLIDLDAHKFRIGSPFCQVLFILCGISNFLGIGRTSLNVVQQFLVLLGKLGPRSRVKDDRTVHRAKYHVGCVPVRDLV